MPSMNHSSDPLAEGLSFEAALPFTWRELDAVPDAPHLTYWNEYNEAALRSIAALDEHTNQPPEEHVTPAYDLSRVELKINLLLDLVGQLLSQQMLLPAPVWVKVGARGMAWNHSQPLAVGRVLLLQLYLNPGYPRALELPARLVSVDQIDGASRCTAAFVGCSESVCDWLEKLVFRHHRRSIAHARGPRSDD